MGVKIFYDAQTRTLLSELSGDIDHCTAKGLREPIDKEIMQRLPLRLILDFSGVTFMDSSGIGLIIGRYKLMTDLGGSIVVADPRPETEKIMKLAGIGRLCGITHTDRNGSFIGGIKI